MKSYGLARIGRDTEVRYTPAGKAVANVSLAFSYGRAAPGSNRPTQWVEGSLWGERAEKTAEYLTKGKQIMVTLGDVHIETFEGRNGPGSKLVAIIEGFEFVSDGQRQGDQATQQRPQQPAAAGAAQARPATGFDDMDDDIPF
jgi:single-strand DNA-binding protein